MPAITPGTPLHSFLDAFREATRDVFSQALAATWMVEIDTREDAPSAEPSAQCFQISMSGGLRGEALIQFATGDALLLAQKFLAETPDPSQELSPDRKEALQELLRQVAGLIATRLKSMFGEAKLEGTNVDAPDWQGVSVTLLASETTSGKLPMWLRLSPELLASVSSTKTTSSVQASDDSGAAAVTHEPNFDLLLGVNLNLTLRFGQRVLPLREILDLTSGSVIELDREVQEPADLLLGDKLIARGEVVIVDGNYGIRITEVLDARQRVGAL